MTYHTLKCSTKNQGIPDTYQLHEYKQLCLLTLSQKMGPHTQNAEVCSREQTTVGSTYSYIHGILEAHGSMSQSETFAVENLKFTPNLA